jgi:hypothetical protein
LAALGQDRGVAGDDVLVEDGHVAASGLDVEVPEQCRADVDWQAVPEQRAPRSRREPPRAPGAAERSTAGAAR